MSTQTVTLTIAQLQNPALLIQALVMQGVDVKTTPYLFWNNIYTAPLRKAIALGESPDYETNAQKYDEYIKTKYNDAFIAIRESAVKRNQQQPTTTAESPKTAQNSAIQNTTAQQPTPTAESPKTADSSMTIPQWLESQYGLSESAVESVILTLADTHIETYALMCDHAIQSFKTPLGKSSRAYKAQTSAIRKALLAESTRRKVYVDYMNQPTPTAESTVPTAQQPTTLTLESLAQMMQQQSQLLAILMQAQQLKA